MTFSFGKIPTNLHPSKINCSARSLVATRCWHCRCLGI
jgi:hypothetical protein